MKIHNSIQLNKPKDKTQQANPDTVASWDTRSGNEVGLYSTDPGHHTETELVTQVFLTFSISWNVVFPQTKNIIQVISVKH